MDPLVSLPPPAPPIVPHLADISNHIGNTGVNEINPARNRVSKRSWSKITTNLLNNLVRIWSHNALDAHRLDEKIASIKEQLSQIDPNYAQICLLITDQISKSKQLPLQLNDQPIQRLIYLNVLTSTYNILTHLQKGPFPLLDIAIEALQHYTQKLSGNSQELSLLDNPATQRQFFTSFVDKFLKIALPDGIIAPTNLLENTVQKQSPKLITKWLSGKLFPKLYKTFISPACTQMALLQGLPILQKILNEGISTSEILSEKAPISKLSKAVKTPPIQNPNLTLKEQQFVDCFSTCIQSIIEFLKLEPILAPIAGINLNQHIKKQITAAATQLVLQCRTLDLMTALSQQLPKVIKLLETASSQPAPSIPSQKSSIQDPRKNIREMVANIQKSQFIGIKKELIKSQLPYKDLRESAFNFYRLKKAVNWLVGSLIGAVFDWFFRTRIQPQFKELMGRVTEVHIPEVTQPLTQLIVKKII